MPAIPTYVSPRNRKTLAVFIPAGIPTPTESGAAAPPQLDYDATAAAIYAGDPSLRCRSIGSHVRKALAKQAAALRRWRDTHGGWLVLGGLPKARKHAYWQFVRECRTYELAEAAGRALDKTLGFAIVPADCAELEWVR